MYTDFFGRQDEVIAELIPHIFGGDKEYTRTYNLNNEQNETTIKLKNIDDYNNNYGYSNFQLTSNSKNIFSIHLIIGGNIIDTIYPNLMDQTSFPIFTANILPALKNLDYELYIDKLNNENIEIKLDIIKINNPLINNKIKSFMFLSTQYTGRNNYKEKGQIKINVPFNHPITKITILSNNELYKPKLILDDYVIPIKKITNNRYEYIFDISVNFTKIESSYIVTDIIDETTIHVFGEYKNIVIFNKDILVLKFSQ